MSTRYRIKQNDLEPPLEIQLLNGTVPVDLSQAASVHFIMRNRTGVKVNRTMEVANQQTAKGVVRYRWVTGDTDTVGTYEAEVQVLWPLDRPQTFPSSQYLAIEITRELPTS